jgi:hypothetical protein
MKCIYLLTLVSVSWGLRRSALQKQHPYYHTSAEIAGAILEIEKTCAVPMTVRWESCGTGCEIQVVDLGGPQSVQPIRNVFLLFGEHARELIAPETALRFIQKICSPGDGMLSSVLRSTRFRVIPNGNPVSRAQVEQGQFCLRTNPNGVDLNRNWPAHWEPSEPQFSVAADTDQLNPGAHPLSEHETRVFQREIANFEPHVFASIHSGTLGMYMPWAYDENADESRIRNLNKMTQVVDELDKKFCQCPAGAAAKEVGYNSPGTCIDWVHSHTKSEYTFAFEIFTGIGVEALRDRFNEQQLRGGRLSLLELDNDVHANANCFLQFNPTTEDQYNNVVNNWADALIELAFITGKK